MDAFLNPQLWLAFVSLLVLEIILGVDNIVFISILSAKLPEHQRSRARRLGLLLALLMRVVLLFALSIVIGLVEPLFTVLGQGISGRDIILLAGGVFLIIKSVHEMHHSVEHPEEESASSGSRKAVASFGAVVVQIMALDAVFSLDSVITAVGMVDELFIMIAAVVIAIGIMMVSANAIGGFVTRHPSVKMLALAFLLLIGATLVAEGLDVHIAKGYIYGPVAFAMLVEGLNLRRAAVRAKRARRERSRVSVE